MKRKIVSAALALCMLTCAFPASAFAEGSTTDLPVVNSSVTSEAESEAESKTEEVKTEESKTEESKTEEPKTEESKTEEPKTEESKTEEVKTEEPKTEESKTEESKTEESKTEEVKTEEPKTEETKVEEPKTEDKAADSEVESEPVMALFSLVAPREATKLAAAVVAAKAGDTITLDADEALASTVTINKNITIDLNGHTLTAPADNAALLVNNGATFTLVATGGGTIQRDNNSSKDTTKSVIQVGNLASVGNVIMNSGTISAVYDSTDKSNNTGWYGVALFHDSSFTMNGGTINAGWPAVAGNGTTDSSQETYGNNATITINNGTLTSSSDYAIYAPAKDGVTTINGGNISGYWGAAQIFNGTLNIKGGTLLTNGDPEATKPADQTDGSYPSGATSVDINSKYGPVTATFSGGTFTTVKGNKAYTTTKGSKGDYSLSITGGTFCSEPVAADIAAGYKAVESDGTWTVKPDLSTATITFDKNSFVYNGQQQGPAVTVTLDGKTLDASCYTVKNGTAKDVGTYNTLSVEGTGAYTGTVTATDSYTITAKELTFDTSDLYAKKAFDGNEHCLSPYVTGTLKLSGVVEGDDPGFTYSNLTGWFESEKAGVQKVTFGPALIGAAITNKNYTLNMDQFTCNGEILAPLTSTDEVTGKNGEEVLVTADPGIKNVPTTLQADPALSTPAKVENKMEEVTKLAITEPMAGVSIDDSKVTVRVMDIKLLVKTTSSGASSGWNDKSAESSKYVDVIPVMIPYSQLDLTFEKAQALNFAVKHMITAAGNAGKIETPSYEVRPNGIYFELTSLSPVAIAYRELATVTFDANGGSVSESQVLTNRDDKIGNMPNVSRGGYDFRGWYTEDGKLVDGNTILLENTKLIAKWERSSGDTSAPAPAAPVDTTPTYFTVNAWVTTGGTVSPIGTTTYKQGVNTTYTMTPAPGYRIVKVVVDGVDVGAVNSYTFNYMNRNHEVGVYFDKATGTAAVRSSSIPQTSDASPLMLWVVLMAVSAVGAGGFFAIRRKKQ